MMAELSRGDVIQITDETHGWYPCLLIVDEVRTWGVIAYAIIIRSNDGTSPVNFAYNRLVNGTFKQVGRAVVTLPNDEETQ